MKKEYTSPNAYVELFTPNQYAGNCQPGISEETLEPITQSCYFYGKGTGNTLVAYTFTLSNRSCKKKETASNGKCTNVNTSVTLITTTASCIIKFDDESSTGAGLETRFASLNGSEFQTTYIWDNMSNGYHWMPATTLPGNSTDSEGRPYYFNS